MANNFAPPLPTHRSTSSSHLGAHDHFAPSPPGPDQTMSDPETTVSTPESREDEKLADQEGLRRRATFAGGRLRPVASHYSDKDDLAFDWGSSSMGAEPGIDPKRAQFSHMNAAVTVYVVDWSPERVKERRFDGESFLRWFGSGEQAGVRPTWATARWINVDGLNWEVIKTLALHFDLHPLALEDAVKFAAHSNSKADWYASQLFVRLLVHSLCTTPPAQGATTSGSSLLRLIGMSKFQRHARDILGGDSQKAGTFAAGAGDENPQHAHGQEGDTFDEDSDAQSSNDNASVLDAKLEEQLAAKSVVNHLTENYRVRIDRQQLSTFLLPSNTLISVFTHSGEKLTRAILKRLHTTGTLLRATSDASMLLQALIDVVVDDALKISEEFRRELDVLEGRALVNPDITAVRHLHILAGQLLMLKRQMNPLSGLINSLRNDDDVRGSVAKMGSKLHPPMIDHSSSTKGYISREAKIYLADVQDHIDATLSSLELFSGVASAIVDFIFNSLSFATNEQQKWLTFISIIFLPLGFLTGYYDKLYLASFCIFMAPWADLLCFSPARMNFAIFPDIGVFPDGTDPHGPNQDGGIVFFWKITGPLLAVLVGLIIVANFGTTFVGFSRRALHKLERHKHHKLLKQRGSLQRRRKPAKLEV